MGVDDQRHMDDELQLLAAAVADRPHRASLTTAEGWLQYMTYVSEKPPLLTRRQYGALSENDRKTYNRKRINYMSGLTELATPSLRAAHDAMWTRLVELAGAGSTARFGVVLSGRAAIGKSSAVTTWGRQVELAIRRAKRLPLPQRTEEPLPRVATSDGGTATFLPVVYATMATSMGGTARNILGFYNETLREKRGVLLDRQIATIARYVNQCQTSVLIIDQIHHIDHAVRGANEVSEIIKQLQDQCPSTLIVGAGIGVEEMDMLTDGHASYDAERLAQTGSRLVIHRMEPYEAASDEGGADWMRFLDMVSRQLLLLDGRERDVHGMADYIHHRTHGITGFAMQLLRTGAGRAITGGDERLSKVLLNTVQLAHFADDGAAQSPSQKGAPARPTTARKRRKPRKLQMTPAPVAGTRRSLG